MLPDDEESPHKKAKRIFGYTYLLLSGTSYTTKNITLIGEVYAKINDGQIAAAIDSAAMFGKGLISHIALDLPSFFLDCGGLISSAV